MSEKNPALHSCAQELSAVIEALLQTEIRDEDGCVHFVDERIPHYMAARARAAVAAYLSQGRA